MSPLPAPTVMDLLFNFNAFIELNNHEVFKIYIRYLLIDTITGYRSQYHSLSAIGALA